MNTVEPIRDKKHIANMREYLHDQDINYYLLFVLGINTGLRISDLLNLKAGDVWDRGPLAEIRTREKKTGKERVCKLNAPAQAALQEYWGDFIEILPEWDLFVMPNGAPISRGQAWRVLNHAAEMCGVPGPIGTHTLRKTFGYHAYQAGVPVELLQKVFGHSSAAITLRYIGITADEVADVYDVVEL